MSEKRIVLHIGAGKCGSSALQTFFSHNPVVNLGGGETLAYGLLTPDDQLLQPNEIVARSAVSIRDYACSASFSEARPVNFIDRVTAAYKADVVLLSYEGWRSEAEFCRDHEILAGGAIEVLFYVRPQVEFLNSAWWQWGAWAPGGKEPFRWIKNQWRSGEWYEAARKWSDLPQVESMKIRILSSDVVADCVAALGLNDVVLRNYSRPERSNQSLPGEILRIMQRHTERLRPSPDDSHIDFVLERSFRDLPGRTPWVITPELMEETLDHFREGNEKLLEMLEPDQQELMLADERWWRPYDPGRLLESPLPIPAVDPAADELLATAFEQLLAKEGRIRSMSRRE